MKYVALLETSPRCAVYQLRANHRAVDTTLQICVAIPLLPGAVNFKAPGRATLSTSICRGTTPARFAQSDYDTIHDVCIRRGRSWMLNLGRHRIGF